MILVSGEALVDLVIEPSGATTAAIGGGPFNTARAIARLGSPVAFHSPISNDRYGALISQQLRDDGVQEWAVCATTTPTTLAAASLDDDGAATYRFYLTDTSITAVRPIALPDGLHSLHVGTLALVIPQFLAAVQQMVDALGESTLLFVDPNCRPSATPDRDAFATALRPMIARADVVKVSSDDLAFLGNGGDPLPAEALLSWGARVVLHTDGPHSVVVHTGAGRRSLPVPQVDVVDTIGAGDAFDGGFLAWWQQAGLGRDDLGDLDALCAAAAAGVAVAAVNCTRRGADAPTAAELGASWQPTQRG
jgi:fructokinase